jgi:hypothetical protein
VVTVPITEKKSSNVLGKKSTAFSICPWQPDSLLKSAPENARLIDFASE